MQDKRLVIPIVLGLFALVLAIAPNAVHAASDPANCTATGVGISLTAFRSDQVTPIGAGTVEVGETIYYQATLSHLGAPNCNFVNGTLFIVVANETHNATPTNAVPLVSFGNPFISALVAHTVEAGDVHVHGDGTLEIHAEALYVNGTSLLGNGQTVNADTTLDLLVAEQNLNITKDVTTTITRVWNWTIDKNGSATNLTLLPGQNGSVNYTVAVNATLVNETYAASGFIVIANPSLFANATITNVTDAMNGVAAAVDCGSPFPITLGPNQSLVCSYNATLPNASSLTNLAVVSTNGTIGGGNATAPVSFANATVTEIDETVVVDDTFAGVLGNATAGNVTVFNYTRNINGTNCSNETLQYNNTATFTTTDTNTTGNDSFSVTVAVPCLLEGCTLTQGYWKTHADPTRKQFDETWLEILPSGPNSTFYLSGQTYIQVMDTAVKGNAYYSLAHQFIAAQLNVLNDASAPANVTSAIANATTLFNTYTPAQIAALKGNDPVRQQFIYLAGILGSYNEGLIGPGHCNETAVVPVIV